MHPGNWWESTLDLIDLSERSGFSEYETLGTFLSNSQNLNEGSYQKGEWLRNGWIFSFTGNIQRAIEVAQRQGLSYVAFEAWGRRDFRKKLVARLLRFLRSRNYSRLSVKRSA